MRIVIDRERCDGYASCVMEAPDVFDLDDDDQAAVVGEPSDADADAIHAAVAACPKQAIAVTPK